MWVPPGGPARVLGEDCCAQSSVQGRSRGAGRLVVGSRRGQAGSCAAPLDRSRPRWTAHARLDRCNQRLRRSNGGTGVQRGHKRSNWQPQRPRTQTPERAPPPKHPHNRAYNPHPGSAHHNNPTPPNRKSPFWPVRGRVEPAGTPSSRRQARRGSARASLMEQCRRQARGTAAWGSGTGRAPMQGQPAEQLPVRMPCRLARAPTRAQHPSRAPRAFHRCPCHGPGYARSSTSTSPGSSSAERSAAGTRARSSRRPEPPPFAW